MERYTLFVSVAALCFIAMLYFAFRLLRRFGPPDWERIQKRRMQGPFVPLSGEEIAEDNARIAAARSKRTS